MVGGHSAKREKGMHTLRMVCRLGFFTGRKKSERSQIKLFAVAINTAGGRKQYCSNGGHSVLGSVRPDTLVCLLGRGALGHLSRLE